MSPRNLLVVAVDGLRASALGAFGNTIFPTPSLDEFAANSYSLDWCYTPSANLAEIYRAFWQSVHPIRPHGSMDDLPSLPQLLGSREYETQLVTDAEAVASHPTASQFDQCLQISKSTNAAGLHRANVISQTALAQLFAAACDVISSAASHSPQLVWIHSRGMYGPWDAPIGLQQMLLDEGDPPPVEAVAPPDMDLEEHDDAEAAFRYSTAYAAQVMALDACWNGLVEATQSADGSHEWLVMLVGTRGFPLGEHRRIGGVDPRLYCEQLHVPWMIKFPDGRGRLARGGELTSPLDLLPTVLEWANATHELQRSEFDGASILPLLSQPGKEWREALVSTTGSQQRAIRMAEWCLRQDAATDDVAELFVRPDDRWEANDVSKLCSDVVDTLRSTMDQCFERMLK